MSRYLARLGRLAYRRRGRFLIGWLLIAGLFGGLAAAFADVGAGAALTVPSTESQSARDMLEDEFPDASGAGGTIVLRAPEGEQITDEKYSYVFDDVEEKAESLDGVRAVLSPDATGAISENGRSALIQVQFEDQSNDVSTDAKDAYADISGDYGDITVAAGGEVATAEPAVGGTEIIGVAVAAVVLIVTFGSLVAAGMTLATALVGVIVGMGGVLALSAVVDFTSVTPILALMLGLAVGIDYALFIFSRYRQERQDGLDGEAAAGHAVGTAGSAVVFAGMTVIIALVGLSLVGVPFLATMGLMGALAVLAAIITAIILTPAMAGFAGDKLLPRSAKTGTHDSRRPAASTDGERTLGNRWVRLVTGHPGVTVLLSVGVLAACFIPATDMQLALPSNGSAPEGTSAREAHDMIADDFGEGYNAQLVIVQQGDSATNVEAATADLARELQDDTTGIETVTPAQFSDDGRTAITTVIPTTGPSDIKTEDLVERIRDDIAPDLDGDTYVTGVTAVGIDVSESLSDALPIYLAVVVGLSLILLTVVFRSLLVPLKAAAGFLLTIGATLGATTAVFQWGWLNFLLDGAPTSPIVSFMPILLVGVLFGLSMDYEVFLVSRMHEDFSRTRDPKGAIVRGFTRSARVVGAAAIIMISVFLGFVLSEDLSVKSMGFALAFGVLVDAFIVRMTLVPAVLALMGRFAWSLPGWLDRRIPDLDVEGASLTRGTEDAEASWVDASEQEAPSSVPERQHSSVSAAMSAVEPASTQQHVATSTTVTADVASGTASPSTPPRVIDALSWELGIDSRDLETWLREISPAGASRGAESSQAARHTEDLGPRLIRHLLDDLDEHR